MEKNSYLPVLVDKAQALYKTIILPEGEDLRVLEAAHIVNKNKMAKIILLGDVEEIQANFLKNNWNSEGIELVNPKTSPKLEDYAKLLFELRKEKGLSLEEAYKMAEVPNYFGTLMIKARDADGLVSGACHSTADTVRPALQIIKSSPGHIVSSAFIIGTPNGEKFIFADCAININPTGHELADIALEAAKTAIKLDIEPKIGFLSYSTYGSGKGEGPEKMREALNLLKQTKEYSELKLEADGEMQVDAALNAAVAKLKAPNSNVAGQAKVLIFPDLTSGNIGYKLLQRLGGCEAYGPILLGLKAPINDLSRGCIVDDIIGTIALTSIQAN